MSNDPITEIINPLMHGLGEFAVSMLNNSRRNNNIDYVQINLPVAMPALPDSRNPIEQRLLGKSPLSLMELEMRLRRIAEDPRPKGVIFGLQGFQMSLADLQTLRDMMIRTRNRGKRVICYAQGYDLAMYYVASAADEILMQPGGSLAPTGLIQQQVYLKDGMEAVGLKFDSVAITPYKGALDTFTRTEPSDAADAQTNWLLDSRYDILTTEIAAGRKIDIDEVKAMIDHAIYTDREALAAGYVDGLLSEEQFQSHFDSKHIVLWEKADNTLLLQVPKYQEKYVAILPLTGMIVNGESESPPVDVPVPFVGGARMGDTSVVRQVRNLMQDENAAAVVLFIDSGGGSATASEAMASALDELARDRPVVTYVNGVAASGGYYISTPSDYVIAQPGTITGSIGVIMGKPITSEALNKLRFNAYQYSRGANASIFASTEPFNDEQRDKLRTSIERIYEQFIERVADARKMKVEDVDKVGGGRVWTGEQAQQHGLVDEMGGLYEAVQKARSMAGLSEDSPVGVVRGKQKPLTAQLAQQANPAAELAYCYENFQSIMNGSAQLLLPIDFKS
ncbi:MAG: signal peptide peptidase SppA [Aggregatilineales bacterium]